MAYFLRCSVFKIVISSCKTVARKRSTVTTATTKTITRSDEAVTLGYETYEPSGGVRNENPILLTHALTATKEYWNDIPQIIAESTQRMVYNLDARNHGDSEWHEESTYIVNTIDLKHFINQLKVEKVILLGHSMGGMSSMRTALQMPEKVEKLIVEDMKLSLIPKDAINLTLSFLYAADQALQRVPPGVSMQEAKKIIKNLIYESFPEKLKKFVNPQSDDHRIILRKNSNGTFSFKSNHKSLREGLKALSTAPHEVTGVYKGPTCFIYGLKSIFNVKEDEPLLKRHFPNSEFMGLEGAHVVHHDNPHIFTEEVLRFINK